MSAALSLEEASRYARTKACVETAIANESSSPKAVSAAAQPPTAALVRDYHAAWTAAMQALPRLQYGDRVNAERADQAASIKLDELWARIAAEANL
ncbi:hypothetical protein A9977_16100 [Variovorax sp. UMC13]|nr:hypothetical protein [Variovorax sp. UMC13]